MDAPITLMSKIQETTEITAETPYNEAKTINITCSPSVYGGVSGIVSQFGTSGNMVKH